MAQTGRMRVGDYEILRRIGGGGAAMVYKARCVSSAKPNVQDGEIVALKVLKGSGGTAEDDARFRREVESLQSLSHPHIVRYRDSFEMPHLMSGNLRCVVMEFLDGRTLRNMIDRLRPGAVPWETLQPVFDQIITALGHAVQHGIIHGEVTPANVFVLDDGSARLIDFGVARRAGAAPGGTTGFPGTFDYMAPDFLRLGGDFHGDEISEIFSLGACLYEALTGAKPFSWGREAGLDYQFRAEFGIGESPALTAAPFHMLNGVREFVNRCLAPDRARRYQDFGQALDDFRKVERRRLKGAAGRYVLEEWLGESAVGERFKARREKDGRSVSIGLLPAGCDATDCARDAKLLRKRAHPNIVRCEDFVSVPGEAAETRYLVMELAEGLPDWSLQGRVSSDGALERDESVFLFGGYLAGLEFLHKHGMLHGDIEPRNLYAPPAGEGAERSPPKLLGLALARIDDAGSPGRDPAYIPPELLLGDARPSAQSDLYSLGLCLYEALVGKLPEAWPPTPADFDLDAAAFRECPGLLHVLATALELEPERRFGSAAEMRESLAGCGGAPVPGVGVAVRKPETLIAAPEIAAARAAAGRAAAAAPAPPVAVPAAALRAAARPRARLGKRGLLRVAAVAAIVLAVALACWGIVAGLPALRLRAAKHRLDRAQLLLVPETRDDFAGAAYVEEAVEALGAAESLSRRHPADGELNELGAELRAYLRRVPQAGEERLRLTLAAGELPAARRFLREWASLRGRAGLLGLDTDAFDAQTARLEALLATEASRLAAANVAADLLTRLADVNTVAELMAFATVSAEAGRKHGFAAPARRELAESVSARGAQLARPLGEASMAAYARSAETHAPADMAEGDRLAASLDALSARLRETWGMDPLTELVADLEARRAAALQQSEDYRKAMARRAKALAGLKGGLAALGDDLGLPELLAGMGRVRAHFSGAEWQAAWRDEEVRTTWSNLVTGCEARIRGEIDRLDPLATRASRLGRVKAMLGDAGTRRALGESRTASLSEELTLQRRRCLLRVSNRSPQPCEVAAGDVPAQAVAPGDTTDLALVVEGEAAQTVLRVTPRDAGYASFEKQVVLRAAAGAELALGAGDFRPLTRPLRVTTSPDGDGATTVLIKQAGQAGEGTPLENGRQTMPGAYEVAFLRPDHRRIEQQVIVPVGEGAFALPFPAEEMWRDSRSDALASLDAAAASGDTSDFVSRLKALRELKLSGEGNQRRRDELIVALVQSAASEACREYRQGVVGFHAGDYGKSRRSFSNAAGALAELGARPARQACLLNAALCAFMAAGDPSARRKSAARILASKLESGALQGQRARDMNGLMNHARSLLSLSREMAKIEVRLMDRMIREMGPVAVDVCD